jgi:hypothetical protein
LRLLSLFHPQYRWRRKIYHLSPQSGYLNPLQRLSPQQEYNRLLSHLVDRLWHRFHHRPFRNPHSSIRPNSRSRSSKRS